MENSMREAIIDHNMEVLHYLTMQPGNLIELALGLFVGITVLTIVIAKVHILSKTGAASLLLTLFAVIICSFFLIQVTSFTKIWLIPLSGMVNVDAMVITGTLAVAFLFLVVPFTRILLHSGYFTSMSAWLLGLLITCGAVYLVSLSYEVKGEGATPLDTFESVKEQVGKELENPSLLDSKK